MPTSNLIAKLRRASAARQNSRCFYCGYLMWETDQSVFAARFALTLRAATRFQCTAEHLVARQDGGGDTEGNIAAACRFCNTTRHKSAKPRSAPAYRIYVQGRLKAHKWHPQKTQALAPPAETSGLRKVIQQGHPQIAPVTFAGSMRNSRPPILGIR